MTLHGTLAGGAGTPVWGCGQLGWRCGQVQTGGTLVQEVLIIRFRVEDSHWVKGVDCWILPIEEKGPN